jgi:hypothetical protein
LKDQPTVILEAVSSREYKRPEISSNSFLNTQRMPSAELAVQVDASLVANQKRVQNDDDLWITIEQRSVISNLNLQDQYFPDWVPLVARALLIDLQIYVELELQKVLKLPGFENIKSCYTLVSFGTMSETC